jgi:hypothetical protein
MTEQVSIAIELPTAASSVVNEVVADLGKGASVDITEPDSSGGASTGLTFDPVSGAAIGWFVLKVAGEAAVALTGAIIGELIYNRIKERQELARKTVRLRFPDGAVYNLVVDDPQSMKRLQQMIADRARR